MKKLVLLFCLFLVFVACGKDKTIEKIIYGDKTSSVLDKQDYDKVSITKSFNSINDFKTYIEQCAENNVNLVGKKFKIRDTFAISNMGFYSIDAKHYFIYRSAIQISEFYLLLTYLDTKEAPEQVEMEIAFIVTKCEYPSYMNSIEGYSYSLQGLK